MDVEIWSDIACPWCYIGKCRFEAALEQWSEEEQILEGRARCFDPLLEETKD